MMLKIKFILVTAILLGLSLATVAAAVEKQSTAAKSAEAPISLSEGMTDTVAREAARVRAEFEKQARSLFERTPLGWNWETIQYLSAWLLGLPNQIDDLILRIMAESRVLGVVGSLIMLTFIIAVFYSLFGQSRVLIRIEKRVQPLTAVIPAEVYPFFLSALRIVVAALIPLILLGGFALINALIHYQQPWFQLTGRLLGLWALGALVLGLLREALTRDLFEATALYGKSIFRLARLALLYILAGIAVSWGAAAFQVPKDVLALLNFAIAVSVVIVLFLLHLKKKALLSLLPDLPYRGYQGFVKALQLYYYPIILLSFLLALLWCLGYKQLGRLVLLKTWFTAAAFILIMLAYDLIKDWLRKWSVKIDPSDETALFLVRSIRSVLLYATVLATAFIILNLLGLLDPLQRIMSFPVLKLGQTQVTFWIIVKAVLILLAFVFASRLLQAYLDYKVYPAVGIDPGLGYALNTFFKYASFVIGFLISLKIVGVDLRFLLVFAGALGIGIGLGLQNMAANVISGFSIIFGGKIRKGDWIEVGGTLGVVTDIYLRATKIRTRDNIEYLVPNAKFIADTIVNYSLSSPLIRINLPVGVSYDADPREVERILLAVAKKEALVSTQEAPAVRFVEFGDSSINFELLVWIDVRKTPRRRVLSALYFAIFEEFEKAGIEIPFPQRDIHIRSRVEQQTAPFETASAKDKRQV